jgi:P-type conjugative transfer protein TrbJ
MKRASIAIVALTVAVCLPTLGTGIPVLDSSNLTQNITTALNSVRQYTQQVQQYQTQLQQLQLQIAQATGLAQVAKIYQQYQQTASQLQNLSAAFTNPSQLTSYLNQFQNYQAWMNVPPSSYPTAVPQFWQQSSADQKSADNAWVQQISAQQQLLTQNALALQRAQSNLNGSGGEVQAIQSTGQILAAMAQELQQIHALLLAQQAAMANQTQTDASQNALTNAAAQKALTWTFTPSSHTGW